MHSEGRARAGFRGPEGAPRDLAGRPAISGLGFVLAALRVGRARLLERVVQAVRSAPVLAKASPKPELAGRVFRFQRRPESGATPRGEGTTSFYPASPSGDTCRIRSGRG